MRESPLVRQLDRLSSTKHSHEVGAGIPKCFQILNDPDAAPGGDYKFDPLGFGGSRDLQEKELANGRLAILGFSGTVTQAVLTGKGFPYTYNGFADLVPPISGNPGGANLSLKIRYLTSL